MQNGSIRWSEMQTETYNTLALKINPVQQHFLNHKPLQLFADQTFQNQFKRHFEKPITHEAKKQIIIIIKQWSTSGPAVLSPL